MSLLGEKTDRQDDADEYACRHLLSAMKGKIFIDGKPVSIASPKDAFANGIGTIQSYLSFRCFYAAAEKHRAGSKGKRKARSQGGFEKVKAISQRYGFEIDLIKKIYEMSVSEKQTVEILKVFVSRRDILILDEPTAVLTPQETQKAVSGASAR